MKDLAKKYKYQEVEERLRAWWQDQQFFKFDSTKQQPLFIVDTPPPYVSADHLHAGHIMSYTQAEFIVRYKRMQGFNVYYPMGFDDNGLPTERYVEQKYKVDKSKISRAEFIKLCLTETKQGAETYRRLWQLLGISVDWSQTYSTIDPVATKVSQWSLLDLNQKGALIRRQEPGLWCPHCQTALAQVDLEDLEQDSQLNYLDFKSEAGANLTIATTRPELLAACVALYVNPQDDRFKELIGQTATVPLFEYSVPIKASDQVSMEYGTGLMMVCTWGDQEDLAKWRADKLETRALISVDGLLTELAGKYQGQTIKAARQNILVDLKEGGLLIKQEPLSHNVKVHERCQTAVEFVLSKQWFIKISGMVDTWLKYGQQLNWFPQFQFQAYKLWVESIKWDWCISRQRYYGVPFPLWYCQSCQEPIWAQEADLPVDPQVDQPSVSSCPACGGGQFMPENDVLDTWATSSCTPFLLKELVPVERRADFFPVSVRPNAFEIIRSWDFYSIVKSHYHFGKLPFKDLMISGHGLDADGKKISKRLGNYLPAEELVAKHGADAIRYWATGANLGNNLRFSEVELAKGQKTAVKLWNVARFWQLTSADLEGGNSLSEVQLEPVDVWILTELNQTIVDVTAYFDQYQYAKAKEALNTFFWARLADLYLEFIKYRLFGKAGHSSQLAAGLTLKFILEAVLKMYAPLIPFVTEEIYQHLFVQPSAELTSPQTIHLSSWPRPIEFESGVDISDFDQAIAAIVEIRAYKSQQGLSLGVELEQYQLQTKLDLNKYGSFVKQAIKVKDLS